MKNIYTRLFVVLCALTIGWSGAWSASSNSTTPPSRAKMATTDDVLTRATTGVANGSTSYSAWSDKTGTSGAVYAGNSAGGNDAIQLRSSNSNSGIVTTSSGGKVAKVVVAWNSNTASGRTVNVYGKNSAYSAASDLYSSGTQGTSLGTIVYGTSTELTVTGDYEYIGIRSASGALYIDALTITWSTSGGGGGGSSTYTVTWSIDGDESRTEEYRQGEAIDLSYNPGECSAGKKFMGWCATEVSEQDAAPTYVTSATMGTSAVTYYAVFAEATTSGGGTPQEVISTGSSGKSDVGNMTGVTCSGLGSDYSSHSPYLLRFDDTNDYIQFDLDATPASLSFDYKMIGGANTSTMTIRECATADGEYTNVEAFTISGTQNSTGTFTTSNEFSHAHVRMVFTKGSNVGIGKISITSAGATTTYTAYSTGCGPNIRAQEVERLTSTKGQTVTSQAITVKGSSLDGSTLSATITGAGAAQFSCTLASSTISAGAITATYTITYKPTEYNALHEAALTFTDGTTLSNELILRGRSLPEQFAIVAYDGANYYVLDGTMSGEAATVKPLPVSVADGKVVRCPLRAVYSMTELAAPDQNVYLVSNGKRLYGAGSSTGLNMKSLTSTSGTNWLLSTSDFSAYHITNATSSNRGVMYSKTSGMFGHYATSNYNTSGYYGNLLLLPINAVCTCLDAPLPGVVARSTSATITWAAVTGATSYEVTCLGGSVSVSGTTATITGLSTNTDYSFTLKAVAAGTDCSQVYNGGFRTTVCDDVPYDIKVTPNVTSAIVRWTAEDDKATVRVYSDAESTSEVVSKADMVSGDEITGLTENRNYYLKVFAGPDQTCSSAAVEFNTISTAVEIVEWMTDGVKILLTGDEMTATVLVEDKQENTHTNANVAKGLFFSKYYEASGNVKLWAIYNGTKDTISLANVKVQVSSNGKDWGYNNGTSHYDDRATTSLSSYGHKKTGYIVPGEEIIIYNEGNTGQDTAVIECMGNTYGYSFSTNPDSMWYQLSGVNTTTFSGDDGLLLLNGTDTLDVIGGINYASAYEKVAKPSWGDGKGWVCTDARDDEGNTIALSTNRCLLVRKNTVTDGLNAVAKNRDDFVTLCDEWWGYAVPTGGDQTQASCDNFSYVGHYDYQGYYAQFDSVTVVENLINNKNPDGTITIPVEGLDTMSCSMMRVKVYEDGVEKATTEKRVPIMIHAGEVKTTDDLFTRHEAEACAECDVVVFGGATLQKGEAASGRNAIHDLTLYPGSKLDLPAGKGDYTVNSLIYRVEGDDVPITELAGNLMAESQKLIVTRRITNDRYYFLSLPYDCESADITLSNGAPAVNGVDFRLLEYDAEARAEEGSQAGVPGHWKMAAGTMKAGQGYAIAVSSTKPKEIVFTMTIPDKNLTEAERTKVTNTVDILEYVGAARNTNHNWNLIAHPYITKFEVTGDGSVEAYWENPSRENTGWVDDWKTWEEPPQPADSTYTHYSDSTSGNSPRRATTPPPGWTESPGGIYVTRPIVVGGKITYEQSWINAVTDIPPFTAMFIQGDGRGEMTFNMYPASPAPKRSAPDSRYETKDNTVFVGVTLRGGNGEQDLTSLRLRPDFGDNYKFGLDLLKFTTFYTERPQLYMKTATDQLAFRAVSDSVAANSWLPMGVYCRDAGTYTFSLYDRYVWDEVEAVYLRDSETAVTTNLLYGNYTIQTTKQLYSNTRFSINVLLRRKVEADTPTMIDHTRDPNAPRKFLRDGVMYILRDGQAYDLTGKPAGPDNHLLNH